MAFLGAAHFFPAGLDMRIMQKMKHTVKTKRWVGMWLICLGIKKK